MLLTTFTYTYEASGPGVHEQKAHAQCIMGMVDGCGYDGQLKYIICDTCRPCNLIPSIVMPPKFDVLTRCSGIYILRSGSFLWTTTPTTEPITLPLVHVCRVKIFFSDDHSLCQYLDSIKDALCKTWWPWRWRCTRKHKVLWFPHSVSCWAGQIAMPLVKQEAW